MNSVFVYDDKLVLTYNYKDGSETLTLQKIEAALSSNLDGMSPPKTPPLSVFGWRGFLLCKSIAKLERYYFLAPAGQPEMMHKSFMRRHLRIFAVRYACRKLYICGMEKDTTTHE